MTLTNLADLREFKVLTARQARFVLARAFTGLSNGRCAAFAGYRTANPNDLRRVGLTVSRHPDVRAALAAVAVLKSTQKETPNGAE